MARIALDAMGGDFAPSATVVGALLALEELDPVHRIQLVGIPGVIRRSLDDALAGAHASLAGHLPRLDLVEAADVIDMSEKPSAVIRGKPNSSMHVGLRLQADGQSDAFVSAGNTGAQMAISSLVLRLHPGLSRPAISTVFPTARQPIVVVDSGANVDCSPAELVQFARLGAVYAEDILGRTNPVVGLLSIGEEPEKGSAAVKEAHQLLRASGLNFQGNVEGRDLPAGGSERGPIDVVVCDGFVGNALLKFYEAVAPFLINMVAQHAGLSNEQLAATFKHLDYSEQGGAPLLGVKGVSIISHGKSSPRAIKNAIKVGVRAVETRMNEHIGRRLSGSEQAGTAA
ncbi:MAG: phosphate acyltransferase PlsX [Gemmatimonadetes bacterium]|nr:phosphate acyltransferase PlsX [Gemmatimonadota bacterium]MCC6774048.1 phosphate acyltransferase PlsX [Gemmatimonadaceae bacterium]